MNSAGVQMPRIIKKYANRRLYDTQISQYITLDDLKKLIVSGIAVQIIDANSKKDISREVLLQLVSEQESLGQPILNEAILTALIRFYDHPMQKLASRYLEMALNLLHQQRSQLSKRMQKLMRSPAQMVSDLTRQNAEWMSELQQTFMSAMNPSRSDEEESSDE
jgi:polyhydroxyalkanoate synthesis repressor PhaR